MGIVGAFVATYLGQALGWYAANEGAGLIGATVGAVLVLLVWGAIARRQEGSNLIPYVRLISSTTLISDAHCRRDRQPRNSPQELIPDS